ncbi:MAG: hypothetical protein COC08_06535 [Maribacter sp.]|nr:MAG: hypothetical protein COC08_06535 [Maribacter sp.]
MNRIILTLCVIVSISCSLHAQRKSELIAEIENLKSQIDSVNSEMIKARKNEKVSMVRAESFESQVTELQDANTTLMRNLNTFAKISSKNSENVNRAMTSLQNKEKQLKAIKNAIASNDSTAIVVLTNAKQTLGENVRISVSNGTIIISKDLTSLFGATTNSKVSSSAEAFIGQVASILTANPNMAITLEGLSMTGELDLAAKQALSVSGVLQEKFEISSDRIMALGKDGNFKEGVNFRIHPKFDQFYLMVRENMKKSN